MDDLAAWLTQILDEEQAIAEQASPGPWHLNAEHDEVWAADDIEVCTAFALSNNQLRWTAAHIALQDPPSVLARIAADRQILADYQAEVTKHREHWERQLARPTSDLHAERGHPHYEYATTEGQRKAWGDVDVPPISRGTCGPEMGWERNVDEGNQGWERFDYTEESYWRRLLPEEKWRSAFVPPVPRHIKHLASAHADRPGYREEWRP